MQLLKDYSQGQKTRQNRRKQEKHDHLRRNPTSLLYQHIKEGETQKMLDAEQIQALKPMEVCLMGSIPVKWKHSSLKTEQLKGISVNLSRQIYINFRVNRNWNTYGTLSCKLIAFIIPLLMVSASVSKYLHIYIYDVIHEKYFNSGLKRIFTGPQRSLFDSRLGLNFFRPSSLLPKIVH